MIAAVIFTDNFGADACDRSIEELRRALKFHYEREFHFTECSDKVRDAFFHCVAREKFSYHAFVINKEKLYAGAPTFRTGKSFYQFAVSIVCENARPLLCDAKIVIDKHGDRAFKLQLEKHLKQQMTDSDGNCLIRKVGMEASHSTTWCNSLIWCVERLRGRSARAVQREAGSGGNFAGRNGVSSCGRSKK